MLLVICTAQMCWFSANKCIHRRTRVTHFLNMECRAERNWCHHSRLSNASCVRCKVVDVLCYSKFPTRTRENAFLLLPKMSPFYICDNFHVRGKFQLLANDLLCWPWFIHLSWNGLYSLAPAWWELFQSQSRHTKVEIFVISCAHS